MSSPRLTVSRRAVLNMGLVAGGGLMLGFRVPGLFESAMAAGPGSSAPEVFAPDAFIRIGGDDAVTLVMPYVEMGQGTYTSIPMLIAEELEVPLSQVRLEHAPPDEKRYGNPVFGGVQMTGGSASIRATWEPLRRAGATARVMLITAAAKRWQVDPESCHAKSGTIVHAASGRSLA